MADLATQQDIEDIKGIGFDSTDNSLVAISEAIANIPTTSLYALGGSNKDGQPVDPSYIFSDFASLGSGINNDVSAISSQFATVNSNIAALPTTADIHLLATSVQATDILNNQATQGTSTLATAENLTYLGSSSDVSNLFNLLTYIANAQGFFGATSEITQFISSLVMTPALTTNVTASSVPTELVSVLTNYNSNILTARTHANTAKNIQTLATVNTALTSLATAQTNWTTLSSNATFTGSITSAYKAGIIQAQLTALQQALLILKSLLRS